MSRSETSSETGPVTKSDAVAMLRQGVKLLRTTYGSKEGFAYRAKEWVAAAEALLASEDAER